MKHLAKKLSELNDEQINELACRLKNCDSKIQIAMDDTVFTPSCDKGYIPDGHGGCVPDLG